MRGGSWINDARNARSAYRNANDPGNADDIIDNPGFRLCLSSRRRAAWTRHAPWTRPRLPPCATGSHRSHVNAWFFSPSPQPLSHEGRGAEKQSVPGRSVSHRGHGEPQGARGAGSRRAQGAAPNAPRAAAFPRRAWVSTQIGNSRRQRVSAPRLRSPLSPCGRGAGGEGWTPAVAPAAGPLSPTPPPRGGRGLFVQALPCCRSDPPALSGRVRNLLLQVVQRNACA